MTKSVEVNVNLDTLIWARESAGYANVMDSRLEKLCLKLKDIESGQTPITLSQLRKLANKYHVSEGIFYLPQKIAEQQLPDINSIHDFRMGANRRKTPELIRYLRDVMQRQQLLCDVLEEDDQPDLSWIGKYADAPAIKIAEALRKMLWGGKEAEKGLKEWKRETEEQLGVAVMEPRPHYQHSIRHQISGIALNSAKLPVVVLNSKDNNERKLFTLIHEIAHLMIKKPGMSGVDSDSGQRIPENQSEERLCNEVAAETLLPNNIFKSYWGDEQRSSENAKAIIDDIVKKIGVSHSACAVRAHRLNLLKEGDMRQLLKTYKSLYQYHQERQKTKNKEKGGGGPPPKYTALGNVGHRMALKSLLAYDEGRVSARELYDVFGVKLKHLTSIAEALDYNLVRWRPPSKESHT